MIRRAAPSDAATLSSIFERSVRAFGASHYEANLIEPWARAMHDIERVTRRIQGLEAGSIHAPQPDSQEDWFVFANPTPIGFYTRRNDELVSLYVDPEAASQGVGSALLAHFEAEAEAAGYERWWLVASLNAIPFYRHRGWHPWEPLTRGDPPLRYEALGMLKGPAGRTLQQLQAMPVPWQS